LNANRRSSRRFRERTVTQAEREVAEHRLATAQTAWQEVLPSASLRRLAVQLVWNHQLRAADALQLAAALSFSRRLRRPVEMVCLDVRLSAAAAAEGFVLVPLTAS